VTPYYDSLIMQVVASGNNREETINTLYQFLDKMVINGVCTNIPLVKKILKDEKFLSGEYDTNFLQGFLERTDVPVLIKEIEQAAGEDATAMDFEMLKIEGSDEIKVLSSQAGVFYLTPSPAEPEFTKEGDIIGVDDTLCLLEAMKLFSALNLRSYAKDGVDLYDAKMSYEVVRVVPMTGQAVNRGDLLFVIRPKS